MGFFNKIFGRSKPSKKSFDDKPPIYGGDGTTEQNAVVINCASMGMANNLMDRFISERHGDKETDWNRTVEFFLNSDQQSTPEIRFLGIKCNNGDEHQYYFNVSRPMNVANKILGLE